MSEFSAALLGLVQGVTEFLPISSSAHLILARTWFGWDPGPFALPFDVACHVGTLVAVVAYFRHDLAKMVGELLRPSRHDEAVPRAWLLVVGTVPIGVVGLAFGDVIERSLRTPEVVAAALAVGAIVFVAVERAHPRVEPRLEASLTVRDALLIGIGQAAALVPGVSRSGATIAVGLLLGLRRESAARFGFLLGIPAIVAATARESLTLRDTIVTNEVLWMFVIGAVTSCAVGYITVKFLLRYLVGHTLDMFAVYRIVLAAAVALPWLW